MKRVINIDEETYNYAKNEPPIICGMNDGLIYQSNMKEAIAQSIPYNPSGDLISREALKERVKNEVCEVCFTSPDERQCSPNCKLCTFNQLIDNAPAIEPDSLKGKCSGSCYLCDVSDCGADTIKEGKNET